MGTIRINGGKRLGGSLFVQGSKNATLPILAATILTKEPCIIDHCPRITDVNHTIGILQAMGGCIKRVSHTVYIDNRDLRPVEIPRETAMKMRSSILFAGALLSVFGRVEIAPPGGCKIGERPIDLHLEGFRNMGAEVREYDGGISITAEKLHAFHHVLRIPSVGATENLILASVLTPGETIIEGAAREPEIKTLCDCLKKAGASIRGEGTNRISINGVQKLKGILYSIPGDRIVAGTYVCAVMAAGGYVHLQGCDAEDMSAFLTIAEKMGTYIVCRENGLYAEMKKRCSNAGSIRTGFYPALPTDMQSLIMAAACLADGKSVIEESVFENRFLIVRALQSMGAKIHVDGQKANVEGANELRAGILQADDLRGGAALVLAALAAKGESFVEHTEYIERGYEDIVRDLRKIGADVSYVE